ncbi:RING-H2 finger protein ATL13 [Brachypodium distachyon]|uniref:RING-type E3 ubiquitin transferase n=1 Tax=Brachypodium distachyon TaxID=15368 RepID=A0A2K2D4W3_BRADI|nr:RING-H2 finger protein ATL13 [Brachypodium distachyon]PNT69325.1 hypothetical protein BRADI_3g53797v3 [Brachypodium distachyon]|eukprot:XP_003570278.1 RING-H2 finger protein ATL13 [Brachypodium distachyon]
MSSNSSSSMAPPSPESSALETVETKISPSILFVVAVLAVVFFVCGLLHLLVRHLLRRHRRRRRAAEQLADGGESATAFQGQLQQLFHLHDAGVDQAFIDALPVFLYKNVVGGGADGDGGGKEAFDCAVCLCEFAAEDELRLLPSCSHAFHVDCIDTWLLSHSTCPLCRSSLLLMAELSPPARGGPVVVMVLESESPSAESESSPQMADADNSEPSGVPGAEEMVEVKLGKFMCVEGNGAIAVPSAGDGAAAAAGSSSNGEAGLGHGQRRCHSMGSSYEYVMEHHTSLRVSITKPPPKKTKHPAAVSRARGAMSECELGASLRLPPLTTSTTTSTQKHPPPPAMVAAGSKFLAKDSFSVSKIWMARKDAAGPGERRTVSFRWPVKEDEDQGRRKSGSEAAEWGDDVESCGGNSAASAAASLAGEQRPSFARRTLLWVVGAGGRPQTSNRVGDCS